MLYHFAFCTACSVDGVTFTLNPCSDPRHAEQLSASVGEYLSRLDEEPRWHEIATEGLPPENEQVLVWTYDSLSVARRDDIGWLGEEDQVVSKVTHWHPLPAPPTRAR